MNCEKDGPYIDKPPMEGPDIDKPHIENDIEEDVSCPDSIRSDTEVKDPRKYNLRRKPRKNYRELNVMKYPPHQYFSSNPGASFNQDLFHQIQFLFIGSKINTL